jgi:hypothetical protein
MGHKNLPATEQERLGVVTHTCNSSTWKAEAGGLQVQG